MHNLSLHNFLKLFIGIVLLIGYQVKVNAQSPPEYEDAGAVQLNSIVFDGEYYFSDLDRDFGDHGHKLYQVDTASFALDFVVENGDTPLDGYLGGIIDVGDDSFRRHGCDFIYEGNMIDFCEQINTQDNGYAYSGRPQFLHFNIVVPLLEVEMVDNDKTLLCGDEILRLELVTVDPNYLLSDLNCNYIFFNSCIEAGIEDDQENEHWEEVFYFNSLDETIVELNVDDINEDFPDFDVRGREIKFRVKQKFENIVSGAWHNCIDASTSVFSQGNILAISLPDYHSASINNIFFLEEPDLAINPLDPVCHGGSASVLIGNIPYAENSAELRIDFMALSYDSNSNADEYEDSGYRWGGQVTEDFDIEPGQTSLELNNDSFVDFGFTEGPYAVKAYHNNDTSLCSSSKVFEIDAPDPLSLEIEPQTLSYSDVYHTSIPDGTGSVTINASGGHNDAKYRYKIEGNNYSTYFNGSSVTINNLLNGTTIILENKDNCSSDSDTVKFKSPDPLEIEIESVNPSTCSVNDQVEERYPHDGNFSFKITGGISPYQLYIENQTHIYTIPDTISHSDLNEWEEMLEGVYELRVSDKGGQTADTSLNLLQTPIRATLRDDNPQVDCNGDKYTVEIDNTEDSYLLYYKKSSNLAYTPFTNGDLALGGGDYNIKITEGDCYHVHDLSVNEPAEIDISNFDHSPATCELENGSLSFDVSGGWPSYGYTVYLMSDIQGFSRREKTISAGGEVVFDSIPAGDYTVEVFNKEQICSKIFDNDGLKVPLYNPLDVLEITLSREESCDNHGDAIIIIKNHDQVMNRENADYSWGHQEVTMNSYGYIRGLSATDSVLQITENTDRACSFVDNDFAITVNNNPVRFTGDENIVDASCRDASNGSIAVAGTGGKGWYRYALGEDDFTGELPIEGFMVKNRKPGAYQISVQDITGCEVTDTFHVGGSDNIPFTVSSVVKKKATCSSSSDGSIELQTILHDLTDMPLALVLEGDTIGAVASGQSFTYRSLSPEQYDIIIRDTLGCHLEQNIILPHEDINPVITNTQVLEEVACPGKTNGRVRIELNRRDVYNYALYVNESSPENVVSSGTVNENSVFDIEGITNNPGYILEVEDTLGCRVSDLVELPLLENPVSLSQIQTPASCDEISNGELYLTADGGFPEDNRYRFHFNKRLPSGQVVESDSLTENLTLEGLSAGDYFKVSVQDKYGCTNRGDPLTIRLKDNYTRINSIVPTHPACIGDATGVLSTSMQWTPATVDYEHWLLTLDEDFKVTDTLSRGAYHLENINFNDLGAGKYELHVLDADGCSDNMSVELVDPEPVIVDVRHNYIRAKGDSTGYIGVSIQGGNHKYEVGWAALPEEDAWSDTDIVATSLFEVEGLGAGDYRVVVRDTANCPYFDGDSWFSRDVSIIEPDEALGIETHEVTDASCNKFTDGWIEVMAGGGWGPDYRYALNGGEKQSTGRFNGLTAGDYNVVVTDTAGVQFNFPLVVDEPDTLNVFVDNIRDASCPLYADGRVEVTAINGIPGTDGLHYFIEDVDDRSLVYGDQHGGQDYQFYQLPKGRYELFVTDAHECLASKPFRVGEPDTAQIFIDHNYVRAKGESTGRISAVVEEGNGMFDYRWFLNKNPYAFHADTTTGAIALDRLDAGRYTLMVRDTAGCVYEESEWMVRRINIREPDTALHFNIDENRAVSCFGDHDGRLRMKPLGGWGDYRYRLDDGAFVTSPVFGELSPGEYQLSVQDSAGIVYSAPAIVAEPDPLQASLTGSRDVNCHGGADGAIHLEAEGGNLSYLVSHDGESWQEGTTIEGLPAGTFIPRVKDTLDCSRQLSAVEIEQPARIRLVDSTIVKSRCSNNEGGIAASFEGGVGAFSYQWYKDTLVSAVERELIKLPGQTDNEATSLFSGRYQAFVTDEHDCTVDFEFFVGDITDLAIDAIDTKDVWCWGNSDGEAEASVIKGNPPYDYTWSERVGDPGGASALEIPAGKHGLMVTDTKGCKAYRDFTIGTPDSLFYDTLNFENPLCPGGRAGQIKVAGTGGTGGYQYQWDNGISGPDAGKLNPGTYTLTLVDAHDCRAEFDFEMDYQRVLRPDLGPDTLICHYDVLTLEAGDYDRFRWSNDEEVLGNSSRLDARSPGRYYLRVQDTDQCLGYDTLSLDVSTLEIEELLTTDVTCANAADGRAEVSVKSDQNNYAVTWPDESDDLVWTNLQGGSYNVSVNNPHGCSDKRHFDIDEPGPLALTTSIHYPLCFGVPDGQLQVSASGGNGSYAYNWQHGPESNKLRKLDKGVYTLELTDAKGCYLSEIYALDYRRELQPSLGPDLSLCTGARAYISPGIFDGYNWFLNGQEMQADSVMEVIDEGRYVVEVSDEDDCLAYDTLRVDRFISEASPDFLTSSSVPLGDTLMLVDVTTPKPAGLEWNFSGNFEIVAEGEYFCEVVFEEEGMQQVTLSALMEGCLGMARKQVLVTPEISDEAGEASGSSGASTFFRSFLVYPNPTDGAFSVDVEIKEAAPVNLYLVRLETGQVIERRRLSGLDSYRQNFNVSVTGQFVLFAECRGERMMEKVMVR